MGTISRTLARIFSALAVALSMAASQANAGPIRVVTLGTSFTAGHGVSKPEAFPAQLEAMLREAGEEVEVRNAGVSGDSTREIRGRVGQAVPGYADLVVLEFSFINDAAAGIPIPETLANSEEIIANITSRGIPVLLVIRGRNQGELKERSEWLKDVIARQRIAWVTILQPDASLWDGQHPNAAAHREIAMGLVAPVSKYLALIKARKARQ